MNRLGWIVAGLFLLVALAFAAMLGPSRRRAGPAPAAEPAVTATAEQPGAGLVIPVAGVAPAQLVDSFSDPRGGGARIHGAIDIPAPRGTPVLAAADGSVEKLFESRPGGNTIYQRAADRRTVYYYAHLDSYAAGLTEGTAVRRGEAIATVGSSGDADPRAPHLHFEVHRMMPGERWWQGTAVDPYPLLAARPAGR